MSTVINAAMAVLEPPPRDTSRNSPLAGKAIQETTNQAPTYLPQVGDISAPGATAEEWDHLDMALGLRTDLVPVVANPKATISPNSSIKKIGKTPSKYNWEGQVSGFLKWPEHRATDAEISQWRNQPDYGICIITREVRGLDVDIYDPVLARKVQAFIAEHLGYALPKRFRANSCKFLHPFKLVGEFGKHVVKLGGENQIEFLLTGQQFVAAGTNASGARIEWEGGMPHKIPELTESQFKDLFNALQNEFGVNEPIMSASPNARQQGVDLGIPDPAVDYMEEKGLILREQSGGLVVACPWGAEHTTGEVGDGSTVYYPAGSNGKTTPGFKCFHGHCTGRKFPHFYEAIGYVADVGFDVVINDPGDIAMPDFNRTKDGVIKSSKENVAKALARTDLCCYQLRLDNFRDEIMLATPGKDDWRAFKDTDYTKLCIQLERSARGAQGFADIGKDRIRDVVALVAESQEFDSAAHWLESQAWDGVPRIAFTLANYFGTADTPYTRAVGVYMWTALAGRVMSPGVKADMVPVAVGVQGAMKSSTVAAISPAPDCFLELDLGGNDDDLARLMRGKLVIELGELKGLRAKEMEHVKSFITRRHENWIPKYREMSKVYPRRCIFFGTTNKDEFLADDTGNRRWLPFDVGTCNPDGMVKDRGQLWAEGRELFKAQGIQWQEAERLASEEHDKFIVCDPWEESIDRWLKEESEISSGAAPLTAVVALRCGVRMEHRNITQAAKDRMAGVLKKMGFESTRQRIDGRQVRCYRRPTSEKTL